MHKKLFSISKGLLELLKKTITNNKDENNK